MKVEFIDVGRGKANWKVMCKTPDYDFLYKQVKSHGVASEDLSFVEVGIGVGKIFAGFRPIGMYRFAEVDNG